MKENKDDNEIIAPSANHVLNLIKEDDRHLNFNNEVIELCEWLIDWPFFDLNFENGRIAKSFINEIELYPDGSPYYWVYSPSSREK